MAYEKTTWVDGETEIDAEKLNKMEQGIEEAGQSSVVDTFNVEDKTTNAPSVRAVEEKFEEAKKDIIVESATIQTNVTFAGNTSKAFSIPSKEGYTGYVLKPVIDGPYADVYGVYLPYYGPASFGIRNVSSTSYEWNIRCVILYVKE